MRPWPAPPAGCDPVSSSSTTGSSRTCSRAGGVPTRSSPGMVKWLHLVSRYGHLRYLPFGWQPIPADRAVFVDVERWSNEQGGRSNDARPPVRPGLPGTHPDRVPHARGASRDSPRLRRRSLGLRRASPRCEPAGWVSATAPRQVSPRPSSGRAAARSPNPRARSRTPRRPSRFRCQRSRRHSSRWAALGPNGIALADVPVHGALSGLLSWAGRTVPASSNDLSVDLFVINDQGVSRYRPSPERLAPVEIAGPDDYWKILHWYRHDRLQVSDRRPDVGWFSAPEGTHNVNAMGPGQYNLNRPGSTWFLPVGDLGLEWFNQLLSSYEWSGFYLMDPDTQKACGVDEFIRPGFLEVGFPIPVFDDLVQLLHASQAACVVQNIRLAAEAMGLGAWPVGLVRGRPRARRLSRGLHRPRLRLPRARSGPQPLRDRHLPRPARREGTGGRPISPVPHRRRRGALRPSAPVRVGRRAQPARQNWAERNQGPYDPGVMQEILEHPKSHISEWVEQAAIATVEYIVDKYGCCPAYINPVRAKFSAQVHHVDVDFYRRFATGDGRPYAITEQITGHFADLASRRTATPPEERDGDPVREGARRLPPRPRRGHLPRWRADHGVRGGPGPEGHPPGPGAGHGQEDGRPLPLCSCGARSASSSSSGILRLYSVDNESMLFGADLWDTAYGRTLLCMVILWCVLVVNGAIITFVLRPKLAGRTGAGVSATQAQAHQQGQIKRGDLGRAPHQGRPGASRSSSRCSVRRSSSAASSRSSEVVRCLRGEPAVVLRPRAWAGRPTSAARSVMELIWRPAQEAMPHRRRSRWPASGWGVATGGSPPLRWPGSGTSGLGLLAEGDESLALVELLRAHPRSRS